MIFSCQTGRSSLRQLSMVSVVCAEAAPASSVLARSVAVRVGARVGLRIVVSHVPAREGP